MSEAPAAPETDSALLPASRQHVPWVMLAGSLVLSILAAFYVADTESWTHTGVAVAVGVLAGGFFLSFLLFFTTRAEVESRAAAERAAGQLLQSQQAVRASERRFRTLFEQSPLSIQLFAPNGRCVLANQAWEQLWGTTVSAALDYNILEDPQLVHNGTAPDIRRAFSGQSVALPAVYYDPAANGRAGRARWVQAQLYPVLDAEGRLQEMVLVHQDVSERKTAEEERTRLLQAEREARAQAESANRTKDEFLATLSHELRTPLNAILGWAQLLRVGGIEGEEFHHALETIERNAKVQSQLVEDLLDLSRIITGKLKLSLQEVDLPAVVDAALDAVRPTAGAKGVTLLPVLDSHAGPVLGDPNRLQQVAWNLLSNAIKFTPKGGTVSVYLNAINGQVELVVSDTGVGIAPEFLPYVFERLRQFDSSSTRRHGGLGLGLAIVRHVVELHGGTVSAKSAGPGKGATFTVVLPVATLPRRMRPIVSDAATARTLSDRKEDLKGVRVLVVDDEADARELVGKILHRSGAEVTAVASAGEALAALERKIPHVLLSDISMPGEDGYFLIRHVRSLPESRGGRVPAVALTALARREDRHEALQAGYQEHLCKPVEPGTLTQTVAALAGKR